MKNILIVSEEDVCRSRMAKTLLADFGRGMRLFTAGVVGGTTIPQVVDEVMEAHGQEISHAPSQSLTEVALDEMDFIITLCDEAQEAVGELGLPAYQLAHLQIADPFSRRADAEQRRAAVEQTYDELHRALFRLYRNVLSDMLMPSCTCGANTYCRCE